MRRFVWCRWLREKISNDANILNNNTRPDTNHFTNHGTLYRKNEHVSSTGNPKFSRPTHNQVRFDLHIWPGILENKILRRFSYEQTLNDKTLRKFLTKFFLKIFR